MIIVNTVSCISLFNASSDSGRLKRLKQTKHYFNVTAGKQVHSRFPTFYCRRRWHKVNVGNRLCNFNYVLKSPWTWAITPKTSKQHSALTITTAIHNKQGFFTWLLLWIHASCITMTSCTAGHSFIFDYKPWGLVSHGTGSPKGLSVGPPNKNCGFGADCLVLQRCVAPICVQQSASCKPRSVSNISCSGLEKLQDSNFHSRSTRGQQHSDEEGLGHLPLSPSHRCGDRGHWNGELSVNVSSQQWLSVSGMCRRCFCWCSCFSAAQWKSRTGARWLVGILLCFTFERNEASALIQPLLFASSGV